VLDFTTELFKVIVAKEQKLYIIDAASEKATTIHILLNEIFHFTFFECKSNCFEITESRMLFYEKNDCFHVVFDIVLIFFLCVEGRNRCVTSCTSTSVSVKYFRGSKCY
jgi:hypothetical protein